MKIKPLFKTIMLLSGLVMSYVSHADITGNTTIQAALHALYNDTGGDYWTDKTGWSGTAPISCLGTTGLSCNTAQTYVDEIRLPGNNLAGEIPPEIGDLTGLVYLYLERNSLSGPIPAALGKLSASLKGLYLYDNQLDGELPVELGSLTNLLNLQFHNNQLSGNIPASFGNLSSLVTFFSDSNKLSGELPNELANLGSSGVTINLKWNAAFSNNVALNDYINSRHLDTYEPSQTTPPTGVKLLNKSTTSVVLGWNYFQTSPETPGGYIILQSTSEFGSYSEVGNGINDRNLNSITINGLKEGVNYWFKVCNYTSPNAYNLKNLVVSEDSIAVSKGVPSVSAGADQYLSEGAAIDLMATASDMDGFIAKYSWQQISGTAVDFTNVDINSAGLSITAPEVSTAGSTLVFGVTVEDDEGDIAYDEVQVFVSNILVDPVVSAVASPSLVDEGNSVTLTANAEDANGTIEKYLWEKVSGTSSGIIIDHTSAIASFIPLIDTASEELIFKVTVTDNDGGTASHQVSVTVNNVIVAPTVNAGLDVTVNEGNPVSLSASADDSNGSIVKYRWQKISGPIMDLGITDWDSASLTFNAPAVDSASEAFVFEVTVTDNDGGTASDTVQVTVNNVLIPPTVKMSADQIVDEGTPVTISADGSDTNGSIGYSWRQVSGTSSATLDVINSSDLSFTAPEVEVGGDVLVFEVTVTDNDGQFVTGQVQVTVNDVKIAPDTEPTTDDPANEVEEDEWIEIYANAFDLDGEIVSYYWEQLAGTEVELESTDTPTTRFIAPSTNGNRSIRLLFRITVTDDDGLTDSALIYIIITKRNVIQVGGGGALGWPWLMLLAVPLLGRRYLK